MKKDNDHPQLPKTGIEVLEYQKEEFSDTNFFTLGPGNQTQSAKTGLKTSVELESLHKTKNRQSTKEETQDSANLNHAG